MARAEKHELLQLDVVEARRRATALAAEREAVHASGAGKVWSTAEAGDMSGRYLHVRGGPAEHPTDSTADSYRHNHAVIAERAVARAGEIRHAIGRATARTTKQSLVG